MPVSVLTALPISREEDAYGQVLGGGLVYTTEAGSDVPLATYQDINCAVANSNPVQLDATGRALIRYLPGRAYKIRVTTRDSAQGAGDGAAQWTVDHYWPPISSEPVSAKSIISALYNPQTAAETAAGVTATDLSWPTGDPRRHGALLDGVSDDTTALRQWAQVPGAHTFPGGYTALITGSITLVSNSSYTFGGGGSIQSAMPNLSFFSASNASHISVTGAIFRQTAVGVTGHVAGVYFNTCTDCKVERCEFSGMQWAGVAIEGCMRCTVRDNYMHDYGGGSLQDSADVYCASTASTAASYNLIEGNQCFGGTNEHGIIVYDPYIGVVPLYNSVTNNNVGAHKGYGIICYVTDSGDSYTRIIGNHVQDIAHFPGTPGASPANENTSSGTGIYAAGAGLGGTVISGNTVKNCCTDTTVASLAPAGIGVNGSNTGSDSVPIVISGNTVSDMSRFNSIIITGWLGGATVTGNTVRHPSQADSNYLGDGIRVTNCDSVSVSGNHITLIATSQNEDGIQIRSQGSGLGCTNVSITGNTIDGGHSGAIRTVVSNSGNVISGLVISGNVCANGDDSCIPLLFDSGSASSVSVTGNQFLATASGPAIKQTACLTVRYSGNRANNGGGGPLVVFSGANTGSYWDMSNASPAGNSTTDNAGTGLQMQIPGTAAPSTGTFAVGDIVQNTSPSAGQPIFWVCTGAGTSGVWKTVSVSA